MKISARKHLEGIVKKIFKASNQKLAITDEVLNAFYKLNDGYGIIKLSKVNEATINEIAKVSFKARVLSENTLTHYKTLYNKSFHPHLADKTKKNEKRLPMIKEVHLTGQDPLKIKNQYLIKIISEAIIAHVKIKTKPKDAITPTGKLHKLVSLISDLKKMGIPSTLIAEFLCEIGFETTPKAINKALERWRQTPPRF
jgi:hypothetical protein